MASEGNKDAVDEALSMEQSSTSGAKRKRGRPRKYEYPTYELPQRAQPIQSVPLLPRHRTQDGSNVRQDGVQASHTLGDSVDPKMCKFQVLSAQQAQGDPGKDGILGKHFIGKVTKKFPGFSLITVKVKDNQVLRGWVPDENSLHPITPKDDLAPELPMLRPSQVRKRASAILTQAAPPVPIHLEDVTLAKPLQMRRPIEKTIAKHTIPLAPRAYMGSGVVAAVPLSVSPCNVETRPLAKQDTKLVIPQPPVGAVPIKSIRPVLVSCKQVANQNELVGENEFQKDSESSTATKESSVKAETLNTALVDVVVKDSPGERQLLNVQSTNPVRESSGQTQHGVTTVIDEIKITSGIGHQPNSANGEHQRCKEPSDITEQSEQLKTDTNAQKGVDGSKSDDVHSAHDEHEMRADSR